MKRLTPLLLLLAVFMLSTPVIAVDNESVWFLNQTGYFASGSSAAHFRSLINSNGTVGGQVNQIRLRITHPNGMRIEDYMYIADVQNGSLYKTDNETNFTFYYNGSKDFYFPPGGEIFSDWINFTFVPGKNYSLTYNYHGGGSSYYLVQSFTEIYSIQYWPDSPSILYDDNWADNAAISAQTSSNGFAVEIIGRNMSFEDYSSTGQINLYNESGVFKDSFGEGEDFNVTADITYNANSSAVPDLSCNYTLYDGISPQEAADQNFTVCSSGCDYSVYNENFTLSQVPRISDTAHFRACHVGSPVFDLEVSFVCNSTYYSNYTIDSSQISQCSDSDIPVYFLPEGNCSGSSEVGLYVSSTAPNAVNAIRVYGLDLDSEVARYEQTMSYDATKQLYVPPEDNEYYEHGLKVVDVNCTHPNTESSLGLSKSFYVVNIPPLVVFSTLAMDSYFFNLTDGAEYDYLNGTYTFNIPVVDDDLDTVNYYFYNSSQNLIYSSSSTPTPYSEIFRDFEGNPYNVTVIANDSTGNVTIASILINFTDVLPPGIQNADNRSEVNASYVSFNVTFTDESFFSYNVSCTSGYAEFQEGLNVQEYVLNVNFTMPDDNVTCTYRYCDGHTKDELKKYWDVKQHKNKVEFRTDAVFVNSLEIKNKNAEFKVDKKNDKYSITVEVDDNFVGSRDYDFVYRASPRSYFFLSEQYPGWIVDGEHELWFDTVGEEEVSVFQTEPGVWEVTITADSNRLELESIGELNCQEHQQIISVTYPPPTPPGTILEVGVCPGSIEGILGLFFMVGTLLAMFVINLLWLRIPALNIVLGIGMFFAAYSVMGCSAMIGMAVVVFGIFMAVSVFMDW